MSMDVMNHFRAPLRETIKKSKSQKLSNSKSLIPLNPQFLNSSIPQFQTPKSIPDTIQWLKLFPSSSPCGIAIVIVCFPGFMNDKSK